MLFDTFSNKEYKETPYPETFKLLDRMTKDEIDAARAELNRKIEGDEIHTAGWMPGADWRKTPFQPIYEKAALKNQSLAAKVFGLLVFDVFREHEEKWLTLRADKDGEPIGSRTYFRDKGK